MFAHRGLDVLPDGQAGEQRPFLEEDAPALADQKPLLWAELVHVVAEDFDRAGLLMDEAQYGTGQNRLARARGADEAKHFASIKIEVEPVHDEVVAEAHLEAVHAYDRLADRIKRRWPPRAQ